MVQTNVLRSRTTIHILILILCGALTIIPTAWAIRSLTSQTWGEALDRAWTLVATALIIFNIGHFLTLKFHSGSLLLDIGPNPSRGLLLFCSLMLFVGGLLSGEFIEIPKLLREGRGFEALSSLLSFVLLSLFFFFFAISRFQIRRRGIWTHGNFVPWKRIRGYRWQDDDTLVLDTRFLGLEGEQIYDIPDEKVRTLKELLETRLGQQAQTL